MFKQLETNEITEALNQNYRTWTHGLSQERYLHYQWWQLTSHWGKKHLSYWGWFHNNKLVASCKTNELTYSSHNKSYRINGISALFVPEIFRGNNFGTTLVSNIVESSRNFSFDAVTLNSDIGYLYYEQQGFKAISNREFVITNTNNQLIKVLEHLSKEYNLKLEQEKNISIIPTKLEQVDLMCRYHKRWLTRQAYGIARNSNYWHFKLSREKYLYRQSKLGWPQQEIIMLNFGDFNGAYALFEQSGIYLRILEIIGDEQACLFLFAKIIEISIKRNIKVLRGSECLLPSKLNLVLQDRKWWRPLIYPLNNLVSSWHEIKPCPLLELDHF